MTTTDATTYIYPTYPTEIFFDALAKFGEEVAKPQFRVLTNLFLDGTTNDYVRVSGVGVEFAEHYASLVSLTSDSVHCPEDAESPGSVAVNFANVVMQQLAKDELVPTKIVASAEGGVAICFVSGEKYADIECFNSGEILGVISNRRDRPRAWEIEQNSNGVALASAKISDFLRG
jgi:hypothetical protein